VNGVTDAYRKGDVFWAPDPFRQGSNPRLWLVLVAEQLPYPGKEYVCAALTTSDLPANHEVGNAWVTGRTPDKKSYCSPWVIGTVKHRAVASPQGRITAEFTDQIIEQCTAVLDGTWELSG